MNKVLEFVMYYIMYLVAGFLGVWLGNLITGEEVNPFTSWLPYLFALVLSVSEYIRKESK